MEEFEIFSDGACDIGKKKAADFHIKTIPFYVSFDGTTYEKEIQELTLEHFYHKILQEKIYPKTSLPSVQDYINAFTPALEEGKDILCFTITTTLSGSYQSAQTARQILGETYPKAKILLINSYSATGSQTLLLLEAAKMRQAGFSAAETFQKCEELKLTSRILFMVGTLDYLEHGGRIGKLASLSGKILNIKPLILLSNGEITVAGIAQSRKKGLKKLTDLAVSHFKKIQESPQDYVFMTGSTNSKEEAKDFESMVSKEIPQASFIPSFQIGATIASHTGPETTGLCFIRKFDA